MICYGDMAQRHYDWVERMGWHNKTVIESIGLIASEIGEAAAESFTTPPSTKLGFELADIILRTMDLAMTSGFDLDEVMKTAEITHRSSTLLETYAEMMVDVGQWINTARYETLGPDFGVAMGKVVKRVETIAKAQGFDLEDEIRGKIQANALKGTRGRKI